VRESTVGGFRPPQLIISITYTVSGYFLNACEKHIVSILFIASSVSNAIISLRGTGS
jgi:hypothetical protein